MTTPLKNGKVFDSVQMMPDEIEYMVDRIKSLDPSMIVEWGSGGSTELWLNAISDDTRLISIEHNKEWFQRAEALKLCYFDNWLETIFVDITNPHFVHGYGDVLEETPFNVADYICPTRDIYEADIYFIDGIVRGACLAGILLNGKPDAEIYIHDYRARTMAYEWITQFRKVELVGTTLAKIS